MEQELSIWCVDCTKEHRDKGDKYYTETFYSLTSAIQHIMETKHEVKIDLEPVWNED